MISGTNQNSSLSRNVSSGIFLRARGRKRVIASGLDVSAFVCPSPRTPKRRCDGEDHQLSPKRLESLPQDLLIRILCGVNHSDLKQLIFVSKSVLDAALIAKKLHFAFSTPLSKPVFSDVDSDLDAPGAPRQTRIGKSRIKGKDISSIAVALFTDSND